MKPAVSAEFAAAFRARAGGKAGLDFGEFMQLALYDAGVGYYRRDRNRIGYAAGTDFFTATSSGMIFGELVVAACRGILGPNDPHDYTFVEIGAEKVGGVLAGVVHPFLASQAVRLADPIALRGRCIVFSNELFDAQPFRRFRFRAGEWRELGVALRDDQLLEIELSVPASVSEWTTCASTRSRSQPPEEGYTVDAPLAAAALADEIAAQPWTGLFVALDYGKSWRELCEATPAGTGRAYFKHTQSNDLLARPGEQDLTCHVCWDWIGEALVRHGFTAPVIESQEAFFVHHAGDFIAAQTAAEAGRFSTRKQALLQLLHPAHLGQKFQVMWAARPGL